MIYTENSIQWWLMQQPAPLEIKQNADKSEFIPIPVVEEKLRQLTGNNWNTRNFFFTIHKYYDGLLLISASLELIVKYEDTERILVGACTFLDRDFAPNTDFAGTAKSECIKNAAKGLGPQFGANLNGRGEAKNGHEKPVIKTKPDTFVRKEYAKAIAANDTEKILKFETMYDFTIG